MNKPLIALAILIIAILIYFFACSEDEPPRRKKKIPEEVSVEEEVELPDVIRKTTQYDSGEEKTEYFVFRVRPDVKTQTFTEYYKSGKNKYQLTYVENKREGEINFWYEDGKDSMKGAFKNDKREGPFNEWHSDGTRKITSTYKDGKLEGDYVEYYPGGKNEMIRKKYKGGVLDGKYVYRKVDGTVKSEIDYKLGKHTGGVK